jgi:hypothetical protein
MPDEDFTFASLIKPGQGTRQTMERELHRRKALDDQVYRWEPGYVYSGAADLLLRHGRFFTGRQLPDQYEQAERQRCFLNALELAEAHPELHYYQGWYLVGTTALAHAWCVDDEGVIEVTFDTMPVTTDGQWVAITDNRGGKIPWLPPEHWSYCGVEFDPAFVRTLVEDHDECSALDPRRQDPAAHGEPFDDVIFRHPYSRAGVPLP